MKVERVKVTEKGTGHRPGVYRKTTYDIGFAIPVVSMPGWTPGDTYSVFVSKMWNGRYCIYKAGGGDRHSGYKTYDNLEDLKKDFKTDERVVMHFLEELPATPKFQGNRVAS
ncbi:MAG: hypothetical protein NXI20_28215 [bacterium]|nr:hypothetical protein [bacterium]